MFHSGLVWTEGGKRTLHLKCFFALRESHILTSIIEFTIACQIKPKSRLQLSLRQSIKYAVFSYWPLWAIVRAMCSALVSLSLAHKLLLRAEYDRHDIAETILSPEKRISKPRMIDGVGWVF